VELLILLALFVLNGVFALSEMALVSSRKARLQQLAEDGLAGAAAALRLANEPSRFLSTIQVGITLIGITSGALGAAALTGDLAAWLSQWPALASSAGSIAAAVVVGGITVASLLVGELVPKRLALIAPERISSVVAKPMRWEVLDMDERRVDKVLAVPPQAPA
jgi:putative hemolysin